VYKSIAVFPRLELPPSLLAPALLAILGLVSVSTHTSAALGHPGRNFSPPASEGSYGLEIVPFDTLVQSWVSSFLLIWKSDLA
jgi:hypothetical protein